MQNTQLFNNDEQKRIATFNPRQIAREKAEKENLIKMNIASEIYLTQNIGIYYNDIMQDIDEDIFASCRSLLDWMRDKDYMRKGKRIQRDGIITEYKRTYPDHFENSKWQTYNLPKFIAFLVYKLTDKNYVNGIKKADLFKRSLIDTDWFMKAVTVAGVRLMEDLYDTNSLTSKKAREAIYLKKTILALLEKTGRIIGRSTKNHNASYMRYELEEITLQTMKSTQKHIQSLINANDEEMKIFHEYEGVFHNALEDVRKNILHIGYEKK